MIALSRFKSIVREACRQARRAGGSAVGVQTIYGKLARHLHGESWERMTVRYKRAMIPLKETEVESLVKAILSSKTPTLPNLAFVATSQDTRPVPLAATEEPLPSRSTSRSEGERTLGDLSRRRVDPFGLGRLVDQQMQIEKALKSSFMETARIAHASFDSPVSRDIQRTFDQMKREADQIQRAFDSVSLSPTMRAAIESVQRINDQWDVFQHSTGIREAIEASQRAERELRASMTLTATQQLTESMQAYRYDAETLFPAFPQVDKTRLY